jgi:hypothetical protein
MLKKSYEKPELIVHGNIAELTKASLKWGGGDKWFSPLEPWTPRWQPKSLPSSGS